MSLLLVATVQLTLRAADQLERLIVTHRLPVETWTRVAQSLRVLEQFPLAGRELASEGGGLRAIIGPWRWLLIGYEYDDAINSVTVVEFHDSRSTTFTPS